MIVAFPSGEQPRSATITRAQVLDLERRLRAAALLLASGTCDAQEQASAAAMLEALAGMLAIIGVEVSTLDAVAGTLVSYRAHGNVALLVDRLRDVLARSGRST